MEVELEPGFANGRSSMGGDDGEGDLLEINWIVPARRGAIIQIGEDGRATVCGL